MSFTKSITTLFMAGAFLSTAVHASPLAPRNVCDTKPTGTSGSAQPISTPTCANAAACQTACEAMSNCDSFVFGLPQGESAPRCLLYAVPAASVPAQDDSNLAVFDKACTSVPTTAPTAADPVGENGSGNAKANNNGNTNANTNANANANANTNKNTNGNANGNANGNTNGKSNGNSGQNQPQQKRGNVCGAAPSGPSTSSPSPLRTDASITSEQACLQLGQQTSGCKSVEFGKPSANGQPECLLFSVAAANLPAPGSGQTFVAYDIGC